MATPTFPSERPASMSARLSELQSLLEAVIDHTTDAIWAVNAREEIALCNAAAAALLERDADSLIGLRMRDVFPSATTSRLEATVRQVLAEGAPITAEEHLVLPSGEVKTMLTLQVAFRDRAGESRGVVAIARDITDRRKNEDGLRKYVDAIVRVRDEERRQIARELHDEAGQALTSMLVRLRALERDPRIEADASLGARITDVVRVGEGLHAELSRLARGLHPGVLETLGLEAALRHLATEARKTGLSVEAALNAGKRLALPIELAAYRIVQESTTNVIKHARAHSMKIEADWSDGTVLRLRVSDDGVGFRKDGRDGGIGLLGIRERVRQLEGQVSIDSGQAGTRLEVVLPLHGSHHTGEP